MLDRISRQAFVEQLFSVKGKRAVVTGATQGIGAMIAEALLLAGAEVMICARKQPAIDEAVKRFSAYGPCSGFAADLATQEGIDRLVDHIGAARAPLDILVNNAGTTWGAPLAKHTRHDFAKVVNLNLTTMYELSRRLFPLLRASARPGESARVILIASMQAFAGPMADNYGYAASKAAIPMLTRHLAREGAPHILVNGIAPGLFRSKMSAHLFDPEHPAFAPMPVPLGRSGEMEDIAGSVIYFCSRAGAWTTGATLLVAGGMASID